LSWTLIKYHIFTTIIIIRKRTITIRIKMITDENSTALDSVCRVLTSGLALWEGHICPIKNVSLCDCKM
jgi:hypothetical protein